MSLYKYLQKFKKTRLDSKSVQKQREIQWRKEKAIVKVERPTNLATARRLGYKAKQGVVLARVRVLRGGKQRPDIKKGRRGRNRGQRLVMNKSYQVICEERVGKNFKNLEVLNSYKVGQDGKHFWYEVIMLDPQHSSLKNDKQLSWVTLGNHRGRVHRGRTSAGRKSRGMAGKGKGYEKARPSARANKNTIK